MRVSHVAVTLVIPAGMPESKAGKATAQSPSAPKWPARSPSLAWVPASRPGRRKQHHSGRDDERPVRRHGLEVSITGRAGQKGHFAKQPSPGPRPAPVGAETRSAMSSNRHRWPKFLRKGVLRKSFARGAKKGRFAKRTHLAGARKRAFCETNPFPPCFQFTFAARP